MKVGHVALRAGVRRHDSGAVKTRRASRAGPCPPILHLHFVRVIVSPARPQPAPSGYVSTARALTKLVNLAVYRRP